jgi:hypothetical protein
VGAARIGLADNPWRRLGEDDAAYLLRVISDEDDDEENENDDDSDERGPNA